MLEVVFTGQVNVEGGAVMSSPEVSTLSFDAREGQVEVGNETDLRRKKDVKNKYLFPNRMVLTLCVNVGKCGYMGIFFNIILFYKRKYRLFMINKVCLSNWN